MLGEGLVLFMCAVLGFAALAVPMDRHWRDLVDGRRGPGRRTLVGLRGAAALLFGTALAVAIHRDGLGFGLLLWTLALSAAALAVSAVVTVMTARTVARRRDEPHPRETLLCTARRLPVLPRGLSLRRHTNAAKHPQGRFRP